MNRHFHTALIAVVLLSLLISPQDVFFAEGTPNEVVAIALRNWPPQYVTDKDTGNPEGFAIDIMNKVADLSDLKVRYVVCDSWPDAFEALRNNKAVLAPNMGITDERLGLYDFTTPYETFRITIFVRNATVGIDEDNALDGKTVGVVAQNQGLVLMRKRGGCNLQIFNSMEEAFMALLAGSVDALVYPEKPLLGMAIRSGLEGKIKIVAKPLQEIKRSIAVRKGEPQLFSKLDNAIRQFIKTPEYQRIYEKWYGKPEPFWNMTRVIIVMGVVLALTIASMLAWRYLSILKLNRFLSEAEERFRGIVENTDAGYFFIDNEGKFQSVNRAWLKMHGYDSRDDVIGRPFTLTQVKADMDSAQQNVEALLTGDAIPTGEFTRLCKDGTVGYHTFSAHPVVQGGQVVGFEGFIIDANARKLAEKEKKAFETRLWKVGKAESLKRMAGAIAHHFNNQISVVLGNLELALDDLPSDAAAREFLTEAMKATRRASEVSGLMLTYIGQSTGKQEILDLSECCRQNLPLIQDTLQKDIVLETAFMTAGPLVSANADQVRQVLTHLISNGAEASGNRKGKVTLIIKAIPASDIPKIHIAPIDWKPDGDIFACIEVSDTGCGIAEEDMDKIFDPFFTTHFTGRGLGLPVALGIVKAWKGAISVESRKNHGSVFRIFLPLVTGEAPRQLRKTTETNNIQECGAVLLIEDQAPVRRMVETMLKGFGASVLTATRGIDAIELFKRHQDVIRCVITDLTMPDMDGWETLTVLRKIRPGIPVILASGYDEAHAMGRNNPEQPNAFLHKPYSKDELKKVLNMALGSEAKKKRLNRSTIIILLMN